MILQTVSCDFRLLPASSWAALHAPFRPAGAAEAQQRVVMPQERSSPVTTSPPTAEVQERVVTPQERSSPVTTAPPMSREASPQVHLRVAPSDALQSRISGPLGFTEKVMDAFMSE